jgi:hypothetical protein
MIGKINARLYSITTSALNVFFAVIGCVFALLLLALLGMLSIIAAGGSTSPSDRIFAIEWAIFTFSSFYLAFRRPQFKSMLSGAIFLFCYIGILLANLVIFFYPG